MATATVEPAQMPQRKQPKSTNPSPDVSAVQPTAKERALKLMRQPFESHQISTMCKPTKKDNPPGNCRDCGKFHKLPSVQLSYVGHAALTDRLLEADPEWTWEPMAYAQDGTPLIDSNGGIWIKLTVAGVTRLGYGDAQGKIGGDAMKERIGDALRNAAMRFGAALDLWHKGTLHLDTPDEDRTTEEKPVEQNPEPVEAQYPPRKPVAEDKPSTPVGSLLPFQKNAFLQAAKKSGKTNAQVLQYLGSLGCESLDEMPKKDFPAALKWAMEG